MTEHQTMNTVAHAAFRRDLARFDAALAAFPAGSRPRADQLVTAWRFFSSEVHHHHDYEEQYFWPALSEVTSNPSLLGDLGDEHGAMRAALAEADTAMHALPADPSADNAAAARSAVAQLRDVLLGHLEHEERELEPLSAQHASSAPMRAATKQVIKAHRGRLGGVLSWLQDGADDSERKFIRKEIPPPVVAVATKVAGRKYRRDVGSVWLTKP